MRPRTCRVFALLSGLAGTVLVVLVCRAVYAVDDTAQSLMFALGIPLVLLSALLAGLLFRLAGRLLSESRNGRNS